MPSRLHHEPRMPNRLLQLAFAAVLLALAQPAPATERARIYTPASPEVVLERLPSTSDPRVRQFEVLKQRMRSRPRDGAAAVALARAYLGYGRDTGDARYLGRAQAVITPWVAVRPPHDDALLVEATILQSRHQFAESRQILEALLKRNPDNAQAWLTLSSVALVQGDMGVARNACTRLVRSADVLVTAGCIASWAMVNGQAKNALLGVDKLLKQEPNAPVGLQSWAHGLLGDAARHLGMNAQADAQFRRALALAPGDNFLLADYADFLLDQGQPKDALVLVRDYSQSDTSFLRQVLAESALRLPVATAHIATMAARFHDLEMRGDSRLYGREEARFALELQHDSARALGLAQANWAIQRAPEDMRVLLEAALAAGNAQAAQPVLEFIAATHFENPMILALAERVAAMPSKNSTDSGVRK